MLCPDTAREVRNTYGECTRAAALQGSPSCPHLQAGQARPHNARTSYRAITLPSTPGDSRDLEARRAQSTRGEQPGTEASKPPAFRRLRGHLPDAHTLASHSVHTHHTPTVCTQSGRTLGTEPRRDGPPVGPGLKCRTVRIDNSTFLILASHPWDVLEEGRLCLREDCPSQGEGALPARLTPPAETLPCTPRPVQGRSLP